MLLSLGPRCCGDRGSCCGWRDGDGTGGKTNGWGPTGGAEAETGAAGVATSATAAAGFEVETEGAAGNAAAFGGDSASHAASFQAAVPRFVGRGPAVVREQAPAAAETAAAALRDASPGEGGVAASVESAETPDAAVGADTQGHDRRAGGTMGHGTGAAAHAARGRASVAIPRLRARTISRRVGSYAHTNDTGAGESGRGQRGSTGSGDDAMGSWKGHNSSCGHQTLGMAWPERVISQRNEDQEAFDHSGVDPELMAGEEEASEEIFLDDESTPRRNNPEPQAREAATGLPRNRVEQGDTATKETDVPSPADLAGDDAI
ncbi:unnamed protein product [Closterium sp. NIES-64]|nr:unnamed protein product [Closterium sp. NIES-64]